MPPVAKSGGRVACRHAAQPRVGMLRADASNGVQKGEAAALMALERIAQRKYKTCRRYNDPGDAHALTFSCFHRRPFFSKERPCGWLIESLQTARDRCNFDLWAYVIMPEHCHVLIFPRDADYSISRILESIKLPVTRRAKSYLERNDPQGLRLMRDEQPGGAVAHRFWQRGGGHDRNLREPKGIHAQIQYIHNNPVRRGLVSLAQEWRWSSAAWYAGVGEVPLVPDAESIPALHPR
jgi:putative transposase